jgi:hypothetical protein
MMSCGCRFDEDGPEDDDDDEEEGCEPFIDANGCVAERRQVGGQDVIVHYDDLPDADVTILRGIPVTTALRTVIDLAAQVDRADLERMVSDSLGRGLFTVEEAYARVAEPDMATRRGAALLRQVLLDRRG